MGLRGWPRRWRSRRAPGPSSTWVGGGVAGAGRLDKAVPLYREAVRRDPRPVFALQKLGSALRHAGQLAESATVLQRATSLAPQMRWRGMSWA